MNYTAKESKDLSEFPSVTIQLPIFNEKEVFPRLLNSVCSLEWPIDKMEIQVLDDSTDETSELVDKLTKDYISRGFIIEVIRRNSRKAFKAGALQNALKFARGEYLAVFDADNIPSPDYLRKTIPHFQDNPILGYVQTRLGHLNRGFNHITEAIAIALDTHFVVEQPARSTLTLVPNFNGSAGIIRKEALLDLGGWGYDTLTEDMDLTYRMRMKGWDQLYLRDVTVEGEVPISLHAFKKQQERWAIGGTQTTKKLLKKIWKAGNLSLPQKMESTLHLSNYFIFPAMLLSFFALLGLVLIGVDPAPLFYTVWGAASTIGGMGVSLMYYSAVKNQGLSLKKKIPFMGLLGALGVGLSAHFSLAVLRGLFTKDITFNTTPKHNINNGKSEDEKSDIEKEQQPFPALEAILTILSILGIASSTVHRLYIAIPTFLVQFICYFTAVYYQIKS
ncbi:MAG: glycosyltransferase [Candidatus Bathyarchaeia archaeon]